MKNRIYILSALVIAILIVVVWWLRENKFTTTVPTSPSVTERIASNVPTTNLPAVVQTPSSPKVDPKYKIIEAIMQARNAKSLDFYGQILDQNNQPVEKVKVTAKVGLFLTINESGGKDYVAESDSSGKFNFTGIHGAGTGFILEKNGYFYDQRQSSSSRPDDYVPDPNSPVIFKIWKLKGAEPMIHHNIQANISCDGSENNFNLQAGRRLPSGNDLTVQLTRNPVNIVRGTPFDWSVTVGVSNGGLVKIADLYPNEAPTGGYQPSITVTMPANTPNWTPSISESYYFYNGNNYGRMTISIQADFQPPPTLFNANIYMNPSGSRNLEFDPSKQVNH